VSQFMRMTLSKILPWKYAMKSPMLIDMKLYAHIDSGYSASIGKKIFIFLVGTSKKHLQVRIADSSIMNYNKVVEVLFIEVG